MDKIKTLSGYGRFNAFKQRSSKYLPKVLSNTYAGSKVVRHSLHEPRLNPATFSTLLLLLVITNNVNINHEQIGQSFECSTDSRDSCFYRVAENFSISKNPPVISAHLPLATTYLARRERTRHGQPRRTRA